MCFSALDVVGARCAERDGHGRLQSTLSHSPPEIACADVNDFSFYHTAHFPVKLCSCGDVGEEKYSEVFFFCRGMNSFNLRMSIER